MREMVRWDRVRVFALIGFAIWAVELLIAAVLVGELLVVETAGDCSFFEGPASDSAVCSSALTLLMVQGLVVLTIASPILAATSLLPLVIAVLLGLDVVWPFVVSRWRERRGSIRAE